MKTQVIQRKQYFRGDQTKLTVGKLGEPEEQRGREAVAGDKVVKAEAGGGEEEGG